MEITVKELTEQILAEVEKVVEVKSKDHLAAIRTEIEAKLESEMKEMPNKVKALNQQEEEAKKPQFKDLGENLQAIAKATLSQGREIDPRLKAAPTGMGEAIPSEGGFLLEPTYSSEIISRVHDGAVLAKKTRKLTLGPNSISIVINAVDEKSRKEGQRWGGVQVYWDDEADTITATKVKWRQMTFKLKRITAAYVATEELLQDTTALTSTMNQAIPEEMAYKVDDALLRGNGAGQPLGILNSGCTVSVAKATGQAADTFIAANVFKMWNAMSARDRVRSEWYMNQDVEEQLPQMAVAVGTGGIPVYLPPSGLVGQPNNGGLYGRPVTPIEQCSELGEVGDVIFADFSQYLMIEKGGIQQAESIHVYFLTNQRVFRFVYRVDGQPQWDTPLLSANGTTKRSPFVTLAQRT